LVAPGPLVTMQTPTLRPVAVGVALGHVAGALLVAHEDVADRESMSGSYTGRIAPPGMPKMGRGPDGG
jgi:hypothetical protein